MRRSILAGLALATLGSGAVAWAQGTGNSAIGSNTPGALDIPERWDCRRIQPEYSDWLEKGNSPDSWKYAGKTYRNVGTDKTYSWQDWLDWADSAGCFAGAHGTETLQTQTLIGGAIGAFGAALIGAQSGSGPKSPG
jgi:hypothetical protein